MRKLIFQVHLYAGLAIGMLLLITGLSGSLLVFGDEIDAALNPSLHQVPPGGGRVPLQAALDAVKQAFPDETVAVLYVPRKVDEAMQFTLRSKGSVKTVSLDPYTNQTLGARERNRTLVGWLDDLHVHLLGGATGETVVGVAGIVLVLLGITGLVVWWPKPGQRLRDGLKIRFGASWKRINYDLHRAGGFFALVLMTLTALTGVGLVFDQLTAKLISALSGTPSRPSRPQGRMPEGAPPRSLDELLAVAETTLPGGELTVILLPQKKGDSIGFRKRFDGEWHPKGRSYVYLNQYSGEMLRVDDARAAPLGMRIVNTLYPLHTGAWGGTMFRGLQILIGLSPGIFFVTGFLMWWNRVAIKRLRRHTTAKAPLTPAISAEALTVPKPDTSPPASERKQSCRAQCNRWYPFPVRGDDSCLRNALRSQLCFVELADARSRNASGLI